MTSIPIFLPLTRAPSKGSTRGPKIDLINISRAQSIATVLDHENYGDHTFIFFGGEDGERVLESMDVIRNMLNEATQQMLSPKRGPF